MSRVTHSFGACAALLALTLLSSSGVYADGRNWNDGPVVSVASIRTVDGHFDDYMRWLATTWKKEQEATKKAGLITAYRVLLVEARTPNDPDVLLIVEFKNWAALDSIGSKLDAITAQVEGSVDKAAQAQVERSKIRTVLGSRTMQEAVLK